jgi:hypothetical protein
MSYLWVNKENCQLYFGKGLNGAQIIELGVYPEKINPALE